MLHIGGTLWTISGVLVDRFPTHLVFVQLDKIMQVWQISLLFYMIFYYLQNQPHVCRCDKLGEAAN